MIDYPPPPKPAFHAKQKSSLEDVLGSHMDSQIKLRRVMQKYMGYEKPKPQRNEGMRGSQGEIFL